jgi:hypothetical protein
MFEIGQKVRTAKSQYVMVVRGRSSAGRVLVCWTDKVGRNRNAVRRQEDLIDVIPPGWEHHPDQSYWGDLTTYSGSTPEDYRHLASGCSVWRTSLDRSWTASRPRDANAICPAIATGVPVRAEAMVLCERWWQQQQAGYVAVLDVPPPETSVTMTEVEHGQGLPAETVTTAEPASGATISPEVARIIAGDPCIGREIPEDPASVSTVVRTVRERMRHGAKVDALQAYRVHYDPQHVWLDLRTSKDAVERIAAGQPDPLAASLVQRFDRSDVRDVFQKLMCPELVAENLALKGENLALKESAVDALRGTGVCPDCGTNPQGCDTCRRFRCARCGVWCSWHTGVDDDHPLHCDSCWQAEHRDEAFAEVRASQDKHIDEVTACHVLLAAAGVPDLSLRLRIAYALGDLALARACGEQLQQACKVKDQEISALKGDSKGESKDDTLRQGQAKSRPTWALFWGSIVTAGVLSAVVAMLACLAR